MPWIEEIASIRAERDELRNKLSMKPESALKASKSAKIVKCAKCREANRRSAELDAQLEKIRETLSKLRAERDELHAQLVSESSAREEAEERAEAAMAKLRHFAQETGEFSVQ